MKLGKDNVIIGNVPEDLEAGDGNVVIGPTDAHGNTIINKPMAAGRGAMADSSSIAIGAGARAGTTVTLGEAIKQLIDIAKAAQDKQSVTLLNIIDTELDKEEPDKSVILRMWDAVQAAASIGGAHSLVQAVTTFLLGL